MDRRMLMTASALLGLAACNRSPTASANDAGGPVNGAAVAAAPATTTDTELEQLKAVKPDDACAWLTPEKLSTSYSGLKFDVHQKVEPRMSGYVWDSRCVFWAGVGTRSFAKDVPTNTVEIFVGTAVSAAKARANLTSRQETATSATGYTAQPALGANAYSIVNTGVATVFFVKGQSEVQINVSDLDSTSDAKVKKAIALAQSL